MNTANRSMLWASILVDEMGRAGICHAIVAPGSRSTPLALALYDHDSIEVYSVLDERAAAFFALGIGLATGKPAALLCTSGTAAANFFPAIIEASQSNVPMLVLTADRPHRLRDSGANQTIDQIKLYGDYVRWFVDVSPPEAHPDDLTLRYLRTTVDRAVATSQGAQAGPVHLNLPFPKPLEPTPIDGDIPQSATYGLGARGRDEGRPFAAMNLVIPPPPGEGVARLADLIQENPRGVIIAGPSTPPDDGLIGTLSKAAGYPILAEPLSGIRFGDQAHGHIISSYDTFLHTSIAGSLKPELVIQIGAMPVSTALLNYLSLHPHARRVVLTESGQWADGLHLTSDVIQGDLKMLLYQLQDVKAWPDADWLGAWQAADDAAWEAIDDLTTREFCEGAILGDVVNGMPEGGALFTANSSPIRHLDQFARHNSKSLAVYANRGASGIDGNLATALGIAQGSGLPTTLVIGDLALYHDLNSLHLIRRLSIKLTIVVINNDGGGLFHRLPIAEYEPPFRELFQTPHGLTFEHAAKMFDLPYTRVDDAAGFRSAFGRAVADDQPYLIEVSSDAAQFERQRRALIDSVEDRVGSRTHPTDNLDHREEIQQ